MLRDFAKLDLHTFAIGELDAEPLALVDVILRDFEAALGEAEPSHAMGEARRTQSDLRDFQSVADLHQYVLVGDFQPIEFKFAMPTVLLRSHDRNAAQDAPAGLVLVIKKRGQPAASIVRGACDQNEVRRPIRASDEPFAAVNDPTVALLFCPRANHAGVGTAAGRGLRHRK